MSDFRVRLETKDGHLIQNRKSKKDFWFLSHGRVDENFANSSVMRDCRENGVRMISYSVRDDGVLVVVEWLNNKR